MMSETICEEVTQEEKKGFRFTFGKGLLAYAGVWVIVTGIICIRLWGALEGYQSNYDAARERANPDILMPDILELYNADNIVKTAGEDWCTQVSEYELEGAAQDVLIQSVEGKKIGFARNDAYTDRKPVYDILADEKKIGLVMLKQEQASDTYGFHLCTLDNAQVLIQQPELSSLVITVAAGDKIMMNDKQVSESYRTQSIALDSSMAKAAAEYSNIEHSKAVYVVEGFVNDPKIRVIHEEIEEIPEQTEDGSYYAVSFAGQDFVDSIKERVLEAGEAYLRNVNRMATFAHAAQYFAPGSKAYDALASAQSGLSWAGKPDEFEILDGRITDCVQYGEDAFTVKTCYKTHRLYREVTYDEEQSIEWLYVKKNGSYVIYDFALTK